MITLMVGGAHQLLIKYLSMTTIPPSRTHPHIISPHICTGLIASIKTLQLKYEGIASNCYHRTLQKLTICNGLLYLPDL